MIPHVGYVLLFGCFLSFAIYLMYTTGGHLTGTRMNE
jgi:hypothetical protein